MLKPMSQVIPSQIRSWSVSQAQGSDYRNRILQMVPWKTLSNQLPTNQQTFDNPRTLALIKMITKYSTTVFTICFSIIFKGFWFVSLLNETRDIFIPHSMSCGGYNTVFDPSVSQSGSSSATPIFFSSAQLLWNCSTNLVKLWKS